jgi:hypothetical protein
MATRMQQRRGTAAQWTAANPILAAGEIGFETDTSKFKMGNGSSTWSALQYFANAAELAAIVDGAPGLLNTLDELAQAIGDDPAFFTTTNNNLALKAPIANPTFTGTVGGVTKSMVGLANVDNTTDANKPVSTATQTALNLKAPLASPALTGTPTAPTADAATNTTQVATTEYVQAKVNSLVNGAPGLLDTLKELSEALGDDEDFAGTMTSALALKASLTNLSDHNTATTNVHGIGDTSVLVTATNLSDSITAAINTHTADQTSVHGIADTTQLALKSEVTAAGTAASTALGTHGALTTSVHGIADTSLLVTVSALEDALDGATVDQSSLAGTGIDWNQADSRFDIDGTIATTAYADQAEADAITAAGSAADTKISTAVGLLTKSSVGLANVDNTADASKPVSTATQTALNLKANLASPTFTGTVSGITSAMVGLGNVENTSDANKPVSTATTTALALKANLASPALTGTPTAPTAAAATNTTQVATTAFVRGEVAALVNSAGSTLDTLGEIATALGNDANLSATLTSAIALKAPLASPTFTGTVTLPTGTVTSGMILDGTILDADVNASAAIAQSKISGLTSDLSAKAPLASPTFTGTVTVAASGVAFTDGTQTKAGVPSLTTITQKSAGYTLGALTDRDSLIEFSAAAVVTIPTDATLNFPIGTSIDILQTGTGAVSIAAATPGTTAVNATPGLTLRGQWSSATLVKRAANAWVVFGDLK